MLAAMASDGATAPFGVMTFNLRYAHPAPNSWAERRPLVRALIEREAPDLIGTQEGLPVQIADLATDMPEYGWIGIGRDPGGGGEHMAIFYRRDRWEPVQHGHFWFSDTPDIPGSRSWGNRIPRMATWAKFRSPAGCALYVVNTHFDHESQNSRENSAQLLLGRIAGFDPGIPVLLLGDFNAAAGANPVYETLTAPGAFVDSWRESGLAEPPFGTFHDFKGEEGAQGAARIDWILARGAVRTQAAEIVRYAHGDQYPSDHYPVVARVELETCR
jgi:endonuclease/exonuclease/phosphatase family metal-dependent hydrolase